MKVKLERENTSQRRAKNIDTRIYGNVSIGEIITMMSDG